MSKINIIAIVRTRNEQDNIAHFILSYRNIADKVLVVDGGSDDDTISIAKRYYPFAEVLPFLPFDNRLYSEDRKYWRNSQGKHINFLIEWAETYNREWIIFDDCDCFPNYYLKKDGRKIIQGCKENKILACRIYMYKSTRYFEKLSKPTGDFTPSLWAWRAGLGYRAKEDTPLQHEFTFDIESNSLKLYPKHALLHYFYEDDVKMDAKLEMRRNILEPGALNPLMFGGNLLPLEDWMML